MLGDLIRDHHQSGRVEWIGLRPARGATMRSVSEVLATADKGLAGDRTAAGRGGGSRQVTLIQEEHLPVIAALAGQQEIAPDTLRRNLLVRGINLTALRGVVFRVGDAVLLGTGSCAPCSKMETALGRGGFNAMRGHGGLTAKVLESGLVAVGAAVVPLPDDVRGTLPRRPSS